MEQRTTRRIVLSLGAVLLFLLLCVNRVCFFRPGILESSASLCTYPLLRVGNWLAMPIRVLITRRMNTAQLNKQIDNLQKQCDTLAAENNRLKATASYQKNIRALTQFQKRYSLQHGTIARIFQKSISSSEQSLLINVGSRDGIAPDNVIVWCNQIIGRISQVYPFYSKLLLISDHTVQVAGTTEDGVAQGIVQGDNNANKLEFSYVSHLVPVTTGSLVISNGLGGLFPAGFALGRITSIRNDGLLHHITLSPTIALNSLEYCLVLDPSKIPAL